MHPVLLQIGPLTIRWYGVMIVIACLTGLWLARKEAERKGIGKDKVDDFFPYAVIGAIICARLYYIAFDDPALFWKDPFHVLAIWQGGIAIHGAILGGLFACILFTRVKHVSFWKFADTLAPSLILGQAIGRIGCFFNGDAHGYPTKMPWGMIYSNESPAGQMFPGQALHPTQLYEMIFNLIIFGVLWKIRKKFKTSGNLFLLYLIMYSGGRILVEHFRADKLTYFNNISAAQSIGGIIIATAFILMFVIQRKSAATLKPVTK
jgi:phosphatidylglycerol:prolipoprotein diacylglycerol transferase